MGNRVRALKYISKVRYERKQGGIIKVKKKSKTVDANFTLFQARDLLIFLIFNRKIKSRYKNIQDIFGCTLMQNF